MEALAHLINAVAALVWPAIAAALLYALASPIKALIQSREFTVQVAGIKLTVGFSIEELNREIAQIKTKLSELEPGGKDMAFSTIAAEAARSGSNGEAEPESSKPSRLGNRILWVDDKPETIALSIAQLRSIGLEVELASSTAEAMRKVEEANPPYDLVLSDIGRYEDGKSVPKAGLVLLKQIRSLHGDLPVLFFSTARTIGLRPIREAIDADKNVYGTGSTTELFDLINRVLTKTSQAKK